MLRAKLGATHPVTLASMQTYAIALDTVGMQQ